MVERRHPPASSGSSTGSVLTALVTCLLVYGLAGIAVWRVTTFHADLRDCGADAATGAAEAVARPAAALRRDPRAGL